MTPRVGFAFIPYQETDLEMGLRLLRAPGHVPIGLFYCTSAGKTIVSQAIAANLLVEQYTHVIFAAPAVTLKQNFGSRCGPGTIMGAVEMPGIHDDQLRIGPRPVKGKLSPDSYMKIKFPDYVIATDGYRKGEKRTVLRTTHAGLIRYIAWLRVQPDGFCRNMLLILDEAHHVREGNEILVFARLWMQKGGRVLLATATPVSGDGIKSSSL